MEYVLPLQENDSSKRHITTLHIMIAFLLFGIGIMCIGLYWFTVISPTFKGKPYVPFIVFGLISIITSALLVFLTVKQNAWLRQRNNNLTFRFVELGLMVVAAGLFYTSGWKIPAGLFGIMSLVLVFALINERRQGAAPSVAVNDKGIILQTPRFRKLDWTGIEQVLLRHQILTISLTDNTLIQRTVSDKASIPSGDFERWCAEQIEAARANRTADVW